MTDPLYIKIVEGLEKLTDGDAFEKCACAILQDLHPSLVSIEGGSDSGFDGRAFEDGQIIQLTCTIRDDVIGNVTGSLNKAKEDGRESSAVIIATSQSLTNRRKQNLETRVKSFGKALVAIYDRGPFADLLYRNPTWRRNLLRIAGHPPALSLFPVNHRPSPAISLIGRGEELGRLCRTEKDGVLVGQPGSGKSYLLQSVVSQSDGLFLVSADIGTVADEVREKEPALIVIDDAGMNQAIVTQLRQFRTESGAEFRLLLAGWPNEADELCKMLGDSTIESLELEGLPQKLILEIIHASQIFGPPGLLHELLHQAAGKPGLAVTLCHLCWNNRLSDVVEGAALFRDTKLSLEKLAGETAVELLAYFALGGDAGFSIAEVAALTGTREIEVHRSSAGMGAAGVIDVSLEGSVTVHPARLRQSLVKEYFLSTPAIDWQPAIKVSRDAASVLESIGGGLLFGGTLDEAIFRSYIKSTNNGTRRMKSLLETYAHCSQEAAEWIVEEYSNEVSNLADVLLQKCPKKVLPLLLVYYDQFNDAIVNESNAMQGIRTWIDSDGPIDVQIQKRQFLLEAFAQCRDKVQSHKTALFVCGLLIRLELFRSSHPPGEPQKVVLTFGVAPIGLIERLRRLWPKVFELVAQLPPIELSMFSHYFHQWMHPENHARCELDSDYGEAARSFATTMLQDVILLVASHWTARRKYIHIANGLGVELSEDDQELSSILYPHREPGDRGYHEAGQIQKARALANQWSTDGPIDDVALRWCKTELEADSFGISWPYFGTTIANQVADQASPQHLMGWFDLLMKFGAPTRIIAPFVHRLCDDPTFLDKLIDTTDERPGWEYLRIELLLLRVDPTSEKWVNAQELIVAYRRQVETLVLRNQLSERALTALLLNPARSVRRKVCGALWSADPSQEIPEALFGAWQSAVPSLSGEDHQLLEIARIFPEAAAEWIRSRIASIPDDPYDARIAGRRDTIDILISNLSIEVRTQLIARYNGQSRETDILKALIGAEVSLFELALANPETASGAERCLELHNPPTPEWFRFAEVFVGRGASSEELYQATTLSFFGWSGPVSEFQEKWRLRYVPLTAHSNPVIQNTGRIGEEFHARKRDEALRREKAAAIRGELP